MTLRINETGKRLYVSSGGFDMSSNTELTLVFTKPDGTQTTKTSADGVTIYGGGTIAGLGTVSANEAVYYDIESGLLDQAGTWGVYLQYDNSGVSPADKFIGEYTTFTVNNLTGG